MQFLRKVIRFLGRFIKYSLICVLVLLIAFFIAIQTSTFQTYLGKKASAWLSEELKTTISIEKVDIDFFSSLVLKGVYVEDLEKDTLLYGSEVICKISDFSYSEYKLDIDEIQLNNIDANLIKYKGESVYNYEFITDYFVPANTIKDTTPSEFKIGYGDLILDNVNFAYINENDTSKTKGMNFSKLRFTGASGTFSDFRSEKDTINVTIKGFKAKEQCGFALENLSTIAHISPLNIKLDSLYLKTDKTLLIGRYYMQTNSWDSYNDYINKVYMDADLKDSCYVSAADIAWFVPEIHGDQNRISISGKVKGTVNSLKGKNLYLAFGKNTEFRGDFNIEGLPNIDETYIHFDIKNLTTSRSDLQTIQIPPFEKNRHLEIPANIGKFGVMKFKGKIDGLVNDIAAYGTLSTAIGNLNADAGISNLSDRKKTLAYHGKLKTNKLNLGVLLENKDIGMVSMNVNLSGKGFTLDDLDAKMEGDIHEVQFKGYPYSNIKITGDFKKRLFNGKFESRDPNANIDFYGSASFVNKIPELDFIATVHRLDFSKLNFFKQDSTSDFSSQISIQLNGSDIDKMTGRINFDDTKYKYLGKEYKLSTFDLQLDQNVSPKVIKLSSGVADVKLSGDFNISNLGDAFTQVFATYYPTFIKQSVEQKNKRNYDNFDYKIKIKKISLINGLFMPDLMIAPNSVVEGQFDASSNTFTMKGNSEKISYGNYNLRNWALNIQSNSDNTMMISTTADKIHVSDSVYFSAFKFNAQSLDKKSTFAINWDNQLKSKQNAGGIAGAVDFSNSGMDVLFKKIDLIVSDSVWSLNKENHLSIDSSGIINFNDLGLSNNGQRIALKGLLSKNPKDQLMISFESFKLVQLNPILKSANLSLDGTISGTSNVSDIFGNVIFSSALDFKKLTINGKAIGTGEVNSFYDKNKEVISLNGSFKKDYAAGTLSDPNFKNLYFSGYYYPSKKENNLDVDFTLQSIDIAIIQPYVQGILNFGKGYISGTARVTGSLNKPLINGKLSLESVRNMRVDYLNTYYTVSGNILLEPDRIAFEGLSLFDMNGKEAIVWGNIFHNNFKDLKLDFDIQANKFMVLNTNQFLNSSYYGKAFVTGNVGIWGSPEFMNMELNLKTEKGTQFNIPLGGPAEVADNDFIRFIKKDTSAIPEEKTDLSGMSLKFNLEATPDAEIQLIFDEKAGDVIKASGKGNITMDINTNGNFEMFGTYTLTDGSYLFTLENFINKKFDIESGSTIKWSGSPYNADINITANYKQRASLAPFFPSVSSSTSSTTATGTAASTTTNVSSAGTSNGDINKRYPVECKLYMRDKLLTPEITFGIALPSVTDDKRQQVLGYINNEQELNRQVFSLLLLKSFVTPLALNNQSGVNAGNAVGANATEMLSNQLSNWLSQLSTNIDVGVNYTPGTTLSNEELDLALSTQLFNDKLSIDGNVGVNNNTQTKTSNMIGDLNIDYKLTDEGKVRVKAFNRSNDTYQTTTSGGQFTQGVGVFFREDFESVAELYRRYKQKVGKKKKTPVDEQKT
ncbi:MAG: translocation/assembly module TamB domain-containing protein [Bacteroidota bacterium]|nr:translocation/assembly module TamB domain-containing protein [Bacteroidota bacterium]